MSLRQIGRAAVGHAFSKKCLLLTNTASSSLLLCLGEYCAQKIKSDSVRVDGEKLQKMAVVGASQGPLNHYTYIWIERIFPGNSRSAIFKKIMADQFLISPVAIAHYFYTSYFLEGRAFRDIYPLFIQKFPHVYLADWIVWPAAQLINFYFVPLSKRVLYINFVTMFYNIFLCYVKND